LIFEKKMAITFALYLIGLAVAANVNLSTIHTSHKKQITRVVLN
jgi:hypothetical protein